MVPTAAVLDLLANTPLAQGPTRRGSRRLPSNSSTLPTGPTRPRPQSHSTGLHQTQGGSDPSRPSPVLGLLKPLEPLPRAGAPLRLPRCRSPSRADRAATALLGAWRRSGPPGRPHRDSIASDSRGSTSRKQPLGPSRHPRPAGRRAPCAGRRRRGPRVGRRRGQAGPRRPYRASAPRRPAARAGAPGRTVNLPARDGHTGQGTEHVRCPVETSGSSWPPDSVVGMTGNEIHWMSTARS